MNRDSPVILRPVRAGDAPHVARMIAKPDVVRYTLFPNVGEDEIRKWIDDAAAGAAGDARKYRWWAIQAHGHPAPAGVCGLVLDEVMNAAEAWYLLDEPFWGRGWGTAAARQLVDLGFREFHLHRVWAHVCLPNQASCRILEKIGLRREGLLRQNLRIQGEWMDSYLYAVLREEWVTLYSVSGSSG